MISVPRRQFVVVTRSTGYDGTEGELPYRLSVDVHGTAAETDDGVITTAAEYREALSDDAPTGGTRGEPDADATREDDDGAEGGDPAGGRDRSAGSDTPEWTSPQDKESTEAAGEESGDGGRIGTFTWVVGGLGRLTLAAGLILGRARRSP